MKKNFLKSKLKNKKGESLVESLVGVLIVTLCVAALATAIVTASKLNAKVKATDVSFKYSTGTSGTSDKIDVKDAKGNVNSFNIKMYEDADKHGYYYYDKAE